MHVLARPYAFLQVGSMRKLHRFEQMQRRRVHLILVHHAMIRMVHEPGVAARMIKPDRRTLEGGGHRRCVRDRGWNDDRGRRTTVSMSTPAARSAITVHRGTPRSKQIPQWSLALVLVRARAKEASKAGRGPWRLGDTGKHGGASWDIHDGRYIRGEVLEDSSIR